MVGRSLCDKEGVSREKLAFVCDSTSAPVSSLIVLNGWGALLLGLIATQKENGYIKTDAIDMLLASLGFNIYAIVILIVVFLFIVFNINIGPMKNTKPKTYKPLVVDAKASLSLMLLPIAFMIFGVFFFLYLTGEGDILKGSGSSSIFYTMVATLIFMFFLYVPKKLSKKEYFSATFSGAKKLFVIALVLLLAFAIGKVTNLLHTGEYLASLLGENIDKTYLGGVVFLLSSFIAFSTGTSWGTFSIMIPIATPLAFYIDPLMIPLAIGAVISGGVFGDHCSPISDTTIISSLASGCDVIEHVKTQLPYALIAGGISFLLFLFLA
jgi:Na+/H+ antiporter NhaC